MIHIQYQSRRVFLCNEVRDFVQEFGLYFQLLDDDKDKKRTKQKSTGNITLSAVCMNVSVKQTYVHVGVVAFILKSSLKLIVLLYLQLQMSSA